MQLEQSILNSCEGLRAIGIKPDEKIALFSDNLCRWLVADQILYFILLYFNNLSSGIMSMGAINVVRGSRSSSEELLQIYNHSERSLKLLHIYCTLQRIKGFNINYVLVLNLNFRISCRQP